MMAAAVAIEITSGAERDLVGIWQRRLTQRGPDGDDGADALLDDLVASIGSLVNNPEKGPVPPELEALGITDFRQLSRFPFRIIYGYQPCLLYTSPSPRDS